MTNELDLEQLLSDILDDSKPLPTEPPPLSKPAPVITPALSDVQLAGEAGMSLEEVLERGYDQLAPSTEELNARDEAQAAAVTQCVTQPFADSALRLEESDVYTPLKMPTFTADDFAETMDIRNFATLVTLNTARWHARVKDKQAGKDAAAANDAHASAFDVKKNLLSGADEMLKKIHKAIDEARTAHYEMTLPWSTTSAQDIGRRTGGRLLPNTLFMEYTTVMAQKKQQMLAALNAFEPEYPALVEAAKKQLGKRFDAREYPNVSSIRSHFGLSFDFQPIPKGDDFAGLPRHQLDALAAKVNQSTRLQAEHALQDAWTRIYEAVARMVERLSSPDKVFHGSLIQNVRDLARLGAHLNFANDQRINDVLHLIGKHLVAHDAQELREKPVLRQTVAAHAASILEEMNK